MRIKLLLLIGLLSGCTSATFDDNAVALSKKVCVENGGVSYYVAGTDNFVTYMSVYCNNNAVFEQVVSYSHKDNEWHYTSAYEYLNDKS